MERDRADHVLTAIDGTLDDYVISRDPEVSGDAMRAAPYQVDLVKVEPPRFLLRELRVATNGCAIMQARITHHKPEVTISVNLTAYGRKILRALSRTARRHRLPILPPVPNGALYARRRRRSHRR